MISPTGKPVRGTDKWGEGRYGAKRGDHLHKGADFICEPGQDVMAPISGLVEREARPYAEGEYSGLLIREALFAVKMFYFEPIKEIVGKFVSMGQKIGVAQDVAKKYPGMTPHIHLEIESIDPTLLLEVSD